MDAKNSRPTIKDLKSFAWIVGGIFGLIGFLPLIKGHRVRIWAEALCGILIGLALIYPLALAPIYKIWMALGEALGWINSRIILGFFFYGVLTPIGILMRLLQKTPISSDFQYDGVTYRKKCNARPTDHLERQF